MHDDLVETGKMAMVALEGDRSCSSNETIHPIGDAFNASRALHHAKQFYIDASIIHKVYTAKRA